MKRVIQEDFKTRIEDLLDCSFLMKITALDPRFKNLKAAALSAGSSTIIGLKKRKKSRTFCPFWRGSYRTKITKKITRRTTEVKGFHFVLLMTKLLHCFKMNETCA